MLVEQFLKDVSEEKGFKFGNPWRFSEKSLGVFVPILRQKVGQEEFEERNYITLEEARDKGVNFKDSGRIDRVILESSIGTPIFLRSGTVLKSTGTQPRVVETSIIITPQEKDIPTKYEIPVRCIHASKPIRSSEKFSYGGFVPTEVTQQLMMKDSGAQARTWNAVNRSTHRLMSSRTGQSSRRSFFASTSDNLIGVMEEVDKFQSDVIDEILKKVPLFEDQVGAIFLDIKEVTGLELFDHPTSWASIHKEVEKRFGESVTKEEQSFFKPDYERIKPLTLQFLKKLIDSEKTEISKNNMVSTVSLRGDGVVGEATLINNKVIHLVGMKIEKVENESTVHMGGSSFRTRSISGLSSSYPAAKRSPKL